MEENQFTRFQVELVSEGQGGGQMFHGAGAYPTEEQVMNNSVPVKDQYSNIEQIARQLGDEAAKTAQKKLGEDAQVVAVKVTRIDNMSTEYYAGGERVPDTTEFDVTLDFSEPKDSRDSSGIQQEVEQQFISSDLF